MQFSHLNILTLLIAGTFALPNDLDTRSIMEARADCKKINPACFGGNVVGKTDCRCKGQNGPCDLWKCPGDGANSVMVCGQSNTGCVWI
ncbi:hypothetical protein HYALB_00010746 [Hymenoscyphus albidus]|uniref:Signal peptide-containing protein n=1 Tax=Hymenoscyphus albidus TaxID=595503 RepID=A0A9N9LKA2_9HELO|nr:hypothetical protein HYALB_00010746 [Hymenoscyphus albidus]